MQKFAIAVIAAIAVLVLFFALRSRQQEEPPKPDSAPRPVATGSGEMARLRNEVEALRRESEIQAKRAAKAEAELARLRADDTSVPPDPKPAGKKSDWKHRRDGKFAEKVKAVDWKKHVKTVVEYWNEMEKARLEGAALAMTPDLIADLTKLQADMAELAKELGLTGAEAMKVYDNRLLSENWQDAMLQEITGGNLTEDQLAKLRATRLYDDDPDFDRENGNILEVWKGLVEHNQAYTHETAGILSADQHASLAQSVTPTFMLSVYAQYSEKSVAGAAGVADFWIAKFKLPADQRTTVETVAAQFMSQQAAIAQSYSNQYGTSLPREAQFELLVKTIEAQIAAEKQLAQSLNVDPELAKKLLKGSGSVIKVTK